MSNIKLFAFLFSFLHAFYGLAQTVLTGQVTDEATKEALIGASVKVTRGGETIRGAITDFDGNYRITLDPGQYDVSVSYTGYQTQSVNGVQVFDNTLNKQDFTLSQGALLQEVVITQYKVPLIKQDEVSTGCQLTAEQIAKMPQRTVTQITATTSGALSGLTGKTKHKETAEPMIGAKALGKVRKRAAAQKARKAELKNMDRMPQRKQSKILKIRAKHLRDSLTIAEQYNPIVENPFQEAAKGNVSTFSIDVDGASYANVRRFLNHGSLPNKDAVRVEEFINRFDYQYDKPIGEHPFEVNTEMAPCPWQPKHRLLRIGLQGMETDLGQLPPSNLVFLVDVSGSMSEPDKLPLVQASLSLLADQLRAVDRVALVVYAGSAGLVLESTPGNEKARIKQAIENLRAGGSTAGGQGIQLAYAKAREHLIPSGNNRVILCTDGDFNVGISDQEGLIKLIEQERESGVYLTVLGFGTDNYQEGTMQMLANKGNGNHGYIDQLSEAKRLFVKEFGGTLFAIAKDVKLQLHFNPQQVAAYRLIGYENRLLAKEDFHDDTKDAGELGARHRVTALYEIIPTGQPLPPQSVLDAALTVVEKPRNDLKINEDDLFVLQLRYKKPKGKAPSRLMEYRFNGAAMSAGVEPGTNFQLAAVAAEFGLLLRDSKYKGNATYASLLERANAIPDNYGDELEELLELIEKAGRLTGQLE
jgi:Ca-activated chloride channel homolog